MSYRSVEEILSAQAKKPKRKNCGDCGKFLPKTEWLPDTEFSGRQQRPICYKCMADYDGPECH